MSIWEKRRKLKHPEWLPDACASLSRALARYYHDKIPASIAVPMLVVPTKRLLRGIYGSDWRVVYELFKQAARNYPSNLWYMRIVPFWHLKVLRKTREEWIAEGAAKFREEYGDYDNEGDFDEDKDECRE